VRILALSCGHVAGMVEFLEIGRGSWIGISSDLVHLVSKSQGEVYAIATSDGVYALEVNRIEFRNWGTVFDFAKWFEPGPLANFSLFPSVEELVEVLEPIARTIIEGKKILVCFSGGKDSSVALAVLKKMCDRVGCEVFAAYVHMPYLEPARFVEEAHKVSKVVGVDLLETEPPRKLVKKYLEREGLPYRRYRWCTYLKTRCLKEVAKSIRADLVAVGDRMWENVKRYNRLSSLIRSGRIHKKRTLYPIALLPISDVTKIVNDLGVVHSAYLRGFLRVSCLMCPYKNVLEIAHSGLDSELEDPGLIESVLRREWRTWYRSAGIELEDFLNEALWRFVPRVAKLFHLVKRYAMEKGALLFKRDEVLKLLSQALLRPCERVRIDVEKIINLQLTMNYGRLYIDVLELVGCSDDEQRRERRYC